jgi:hypothetical protein
VDTIHAAFEKQFILSATRIARDDEHGHCDGMDATIYRELQQLHY